MNSQCRCWTNGLVRHAAAQGAPPETFASGLAFAPGDGSLQGIALTNTYVVVLTKTAILRFTK